MENYGFVYIWHDKKHKRFYIGSHWGNENDGYVCSSSWMKKSYSRRPEDFKRRILEKIYTSKVDTFIREQHCLNMIKPHERGKKYYNLRTSIKYYIDSLKDDRRSVKDKISETKKRFWSDSSSDKLKQAISNFHKERGTKPPSQKGRIPWNKGLTKETDSRVLANALACCKPKSNTKNMGRYNKRNKILTENII